MLNRGMIWVWIVLAASLLASHWAWSSARVDTTAAAEERFEFRKGEIVKAVRGRMAAYEQVLRGARGLFMASDSVSREEWRSYVETLDIEESYPGIQGIGYSEWILPQDLRSYEARIRAEGFPDFTVRPNGRRGEYTSITYIEPFDERNRQAFGFDMWSQETRRAAMRRARNTGETQISGRVTLVQEIDSDVQAGFLMYLPFYGRGVQPVTEAGRIQSLAGFVYAPFRMRDLKEGIVGRHLPDVRLRIFDGRQMLSDALMYDSGRESSDEPEGFQPLFKGTQEISIHGHSWTLQFTSTPAFAATIDGARANIILAAGLVTSLLVFGLLWSFSMTRFRAEKIAQGMTHALDQRAKELARSNAELQQFAYVASHDLKAPLRGIDNLASWIEQDLDHVLEGEPRENMMLLRGRIRRLETLLEDLLRYSRADRGSRRLETVDVAQLVTDLFDLLNSENRFSLVLEGDPLRFETARPALEQVLGNLISNAMKHHDRPKGCITVTVRDKDTQFFEFAVSDDGPGIASEYERKVFEMFQTLKARDEVEGSGMGLAIVKKIVEAQAGTIRIEPTQSARGVTFRFDWPKQWKQLDK